jgi:hypothetical protein
MAGTRASGSMTAAEIASTSAAPASTGGFDGLGHAASLPTRRSTGHADALAAQAAHGDDQENDERGNGRQRHGHQLDGVLNAADGVLHFGAAVFDLALLLVVDVGARHFQAAVLGRFQVGDHHLFGLLVQVAALLHLAHGAIQARLRFLQALVGERFRLLGFVQALGFVGARARLHGFQRALLRPALAQRDEGRIAGQLIHAVQQERDVIEVQILHAVAPQFEELLAHQVGVGDHDGVHRARASLPLNARGQHVIAFVRIVRRILIDGHAEHAALHQIVPADHAGIGAGLQQRHERRAALALQHAGVQQHDFLQSGGDGVLLVETLAHEDNFLGQALELRVRIVVVPGDAVGLPGDAQQIHERAEIGRRFGGSLRGGSCGARSRSKAGMGSTSSRVGLPRPT